MSNAQPLSSRSISSTSACCPVSAPDARSASRTERLGPEVTRSGSYASTTSRCVVSATDSYDGPE